MAAVRPWGGEEDQGKDGRANEKQLPDLFK